MNAKQRKKSLVYVLTRTKPYHIIYDCDSVSICWVKAPTKHWNKVFNRFGKK